MRALLAIAMLLAAPAVAHGRAATTPDPAVAVAAAKAGPPMRLWYRVSATVEQTRGGESFELKGNDPVVRVLKQHRSRVAYRLRSRHAVLLYRQCTPLASDADPKLLARVVETGTTTTCARVRRFSRGRVRPRELRALRLVDDVRFTAAGEGALDAFERTIDAPAHTFRFANTVGNAVCPPTQDVRRIVQLPLEIGGALRTASAARDGVSADLGLPSGLVAVETGTAGGPCIHDLTGRELTVSRLVQGQASTAGLWESTAFGRFPTSPAPRFRIGKRFGRAFTITRSQTLTEPVTPSWQTVPWTTTLTTTLHFDPCPRRGRRVDGC